MRYPDGGGLTAAGWRRREWVRLTAAAMFEQDVEPVQVARELRVSTTSAYEWRRVRAGGAAALAFKGAGGPHTAGRKTSRGYWGGWPR
jgi:hypothetical protein